MIQIMDQSWELASYFVPKTIIIVYYIIHYDYVGLWLRPCYSYNQTVLLKCRKCPTEL